MGRLTGKLASNDQRDISYHKVSVSVLKMGEEEEKDRFRVRTVHAVLKKQDR